MILGQHAGGSLKRQFLREFAAILVLNLFFCAGPVLAVDEKLFIDSDDESSLFKDADRKWQEQDLVLPSYPAGRELLEVKLGLRNFPFAIFIDPQSLTVDGDQVIRYTAVLRSRTGAENVLYEGIRCSQRMTRRYAYGGAGAFHLAQNSKWRFIQSGGQDRYRSALVSEYFCTLSGRLPRNEILRKIERNSPSRYRFGAEE